MARGMPDHKMTAHQHDMTLISTFLYSRKPYSYFNVDIVIYIIFIVLEVRLINYQQIHPDSVPAAQQMFTFVMAALWYHYVWPGFNLSLEFHTLKEKEGSPLHHLASDYKVSTPEAIDSGLPQTDTELWHEHRAVGPDIKETHNDATLW